MTLVKNPQIVYKSIPKEYPIPGETTVYDDSRTIDLETVPLNGGFLTKTLVVSPEPFMRERLRDPKIPSYSTPMKLGYAITSFGLVKVLRSEDPSAQPGDYIYGVTPWEAYTVQPWEGRLISKPGELPPYTLDVDAVLPMKVEKNPALPWASLPGTLGGPSQTAWMGLEEYGDMKKGETIFVSTGAGAVGSLVIQFAKLAGLKTIASTGTDEKVQYLTEELGVDHAFNYNTTPVNEVLAKYGPIDIYWDNVGGRTLEAAIEHANLHGRIIACGVMSEYNTTERYGITNTRWLFKKRLHIHGLLTLDLTPKYAERFFKEVPALLASGKIKTKDYIVHGLENADTAFLEMLQGKHLGKTVVVVAEDD